MYLQIRSAAKALNMSRQWLHHLIKLGTIGTSEIDGRRFVLEDERFKAIQRERAKANRNQKPA